MVVCYKKYSCCYIYHNNMQKKTNPPSELWHNLRLCEMVERMWFAQYQWWKSSLNMGLYLCKSSHSTLTAHKHGSYLNNEEAWTQWASYHGSHTDLNNKWANTSPTQRHIFKTWQGINIWPKMISHKHAAHNRQDKNSGLNLRDPINDITLSTLTIWQYKIM